MDENTCIAVYVPISTKVALKVTNFERDILGNTYHFDCWKVYEIHFADCREFHKHLLATFYTVAGALQYARDCAAELQF